MTGIPIFIVASKHPAFLLLKCRLIQGPINDPTASHNWKKCDLLKQYPQTNSVHFKVAQKIESLQILNRKWQCETKIKEKLCPEDSLEPWYGPDPRVHWGFDLPFSVQDLKNFNFVGDLGMNYYLYSYLWILFCILISFLKYVVLNTTSICILDDLGTPVISASLLPFRFGFLFIFLVAHYQLRMSYHI